MRKAWNAYVKEIAHSVLLGGLYFAITSRIPYEVFIFTMELACQKMQDQGQEELRNKVTRILKSDKPPPSNITKEETETIHTLAKDNLITIIPARQRKNHSCHGHGTI